MLEALARIYRRDLSTLRRELDLYPDDASIWRSVPGLPNSGGTLILHVAGSLRHFVGAVLGGSGYVRDRDAEFAARNVPRERLAAVIESASEEVGAALAGLDPTRLAEPFPVPVGGVVLPTETFLLHMATHVAFHLGQVDGHRRVVSRNAAAAGALSIPALLAGDGLARR